MQPHLSRYIPAILALLLLFSASCSSTSETLNFAFPGLSFERPVDLQNAGDGSDRLFVVEQAGRIIAFDNNTDTQESSVFLDIRARVRDNGNEEGLLGLAFHPEYTQNGYFYVNYTASDPRRTVVSRFQVSDSDANAAQENSELVLLEIEQPYSNHNGGQLAFGPDNYLYIATGDGGSAGDPMKHGQNRSTLLGAILRIDVDNPSNNNNYGIPADNPFVGEADHLRKEIYAYGLRNPWRFSFDAETGELWAADVGQNSYEEINKITNGGNYGWNYREAAHCYEPSNNCPTDNLIDPVHEYGRSGGGSITGGYVYRGTKLTDYYGKYFYADYASGRIWFLSDINTNTPANTELLNTSLNISSFGVDEAGEMYLCAFDGRIYKLTPP